MPVYEYAPVDASCDFCKDHFDWMQPMDSATLDVCPECGNPIEKVITAPNINSRVGDVLSPSNLAAKGFTQYKKDNDGQYRKTAGNGPELLKKKPGDA